MYLKTLGNPSVILDIGAQTGLYTLFAKYLPQSKIYAFEPSVKNFNVLFTLILLWLSNLIC